MSIMPFSGAAAAGDSNGGILPLPPGVAPTFGRDSYGLVNMIHEEPKKIYYIKHSGDPSLTLRIPSISVLLIIGPDVETTYGPWFGANPNLGLIGEAPGETADSKIETSLFRGFETEDALPTERVLEDIRHNCDLLMQVGPYGHKRTVLTDPPSPNQGQELEWFLILTPGLELNANDVIRVGVPAISDGRGITHMSMSPYGAYYHGGLPAAFIPATL